MDVNTLLGRGLVTPLRRQGGDFAYASGSELVESAVRQVMITRKGELRWNPGFGNRINEIRHRAMTVTLLAEVQADVTSALLSLEPRVEVVNVQVEKSDDPNRPTLLIVRVAWRAVTRSRKRSTVLTDTTVTEVQI